VLHLASSKDGAPEKSSPFVCFGCTTTGLEGALPPKAGSSNALGSLLDESSDSMRKVTTDGSITGSEIRGCLKSNSKRDSLEHCIAVSEEPRESLEEVQMLKAGMERRKV
jgi:hypothetical protein